MQICRLHTVWKWYVKTNKNRKEVRKVGAFNLGLAPRQQLLFSSLQSWYVLSPPVCVCVSVYCLASCVYVSVNGWMEEVRPRSKWAVSDTLQPCSLSLCVTTPPLSLSKVVSRSISVPQWQRPAGNTEEKKLRENQFHMQQVQDLTWKSPRFLFICCFFFTTFYFQDIFGTKFCLLRWNCVCCEKVFHFLEMHQFLCTSFFLQKWSTRKINATNKSFIVCVVQHV